MRDNPRVRGGNYSFYLSEEQIRLLDEAHWRERKSVSEIVREAIDAWLKSHAEGNNTFSLEKWQEDPEFIALPTLLSPEDRWNTYIKDCKDDEVTKIAIALTNIKKMINSRRTMEFKEKKVPMNNFRRG